MIKVRVTTTEVIQLTQSPGHVKRISIKLTSWASNRMGTGRAKTQRKTYGHENRFRQVRTGNAACTLRSAPYPSTPTFPSVSCCEFVLVSCEKIVKRLLLLPVIYWVRLRIFASQANVFVCAPPLRFCRIYYLEMNKCNYKKVHTLTMS